MTMDELSGETILKLFQDIKTDIRHDIAGLDTRFSTLMERMVTKDVFEAEQRHHSDQHRLMEEKIREETSRAATALTDAEDRLTAATVENENAIRSLKADLEAAEKARQTQRKAFWVTVGGGFLATAAAVSGLVAAFASLPH